LKKARKAYGMRVLVRYIPEVDPERAPRFGAEVGNVNANDLFAQDGSHPGFSIISTPLATLARRSHCPLRTCRIQD
jgi:hypothetical protein